MILLSKNKPISPIHTSEVDGGILLAVPLYFDSGTPQLSEYTNRLQLADQQNVSNSPIC